MMDPLVSVVIPVKNGARFLSAALDSVRAQSCTDFELIVVDGHSTDASAEIALRYGARIIAQQSQGFAGAWNEGIAAAGGEFVAFLDSDDLWAPCKLALQTDYLRQHPDIQFTVAFARFFLTEGAPLPPAFARPGLLETEHVGNFPGNLLARRALFAAVGGFDTTLKIASDVEWFARVKDLGIPMAVLPATLLFKRLHQDNLSHGALSQEHWSSEIVAVMKASLDRQRGRR